MRHILKLSLAAAASAALSTPAMAAVTVTDTTGTPLTNQIYGIKGTGTTVKGSAPNNDDTGNVTFTANTIVSMGNGAAQISDDTPKDPDWTWLIINPDDNFTDFKWGVQLTDLGTVSVYYLLAGSGLDANDPLSYTLFADSYTGDDGNLNKLLSGSTFDGFMIKTNTAIEFFEVKQMSYNGAVAAVPEPGTWALMLLGFGGMGVALRRRRKDGAQLQIA